MEQMAESPHQPESLDDFVEPSQLPILNYDMRQKEASKIFKLLSLVSLFFTVAKLISQ